MANSLALVWDLIAVDNASGTFTRVGAAADSTTGSVKRLMEGFGALAVGGALVMATKQAAEFQKQMLLVQTQAGATSKEVADMSPKILALAGQVAQAPEALANSLYHVESTGLRGAQALDAVKIAAEGAKVGNASLEETTNALTATIASGMLPATETYAQAMGQLNTIVGSGDMKLSDLNDALSTGLLVTVKQFGLNINDVGAALADFGDNNIRGADAATRLRMAVQAIAAPGKAAAGELARIGLTVEQLQSDQATGGLNKALTDLHDHLVKSGIDASQWGDLLTQAFTKKAGSGVLTLIGTFDRFQQKYEEVSKGANSFGSAWEATTHTASFQFGQLKDSVDALGIQLGTHLLPVLGDMAGWLASTGVPAIGHFASGVGDVVHWFTELPGPVKDTAMALAALGLAEKIGLLGKLGAAVGGVRTAFAGLRDEMALQQALAGMESTAGAATKLDGALGTLAARGMAGLKAAGSGLMGMFGGPWGMALLGATALVGTLSAAIQQARDTENKWTEALKKGGDAAAKANLQMDQTEAKFRQVTTGAQGFADKLLGLGNIINQSTVPQAKDARKAYNDWYQSLGVVEQSTQDVQNRTAALSEAMKKYGAGSLQVVSAEQQLQRAQQDQKYWQDLLNDSTKTAEERARDLANVQLTLAQSSLDSKSSYDVFNSQLRQYNDQVAAGTLKGADLTNTQDMLANSALSAGSAAEKTGASWAQANGIQDTATAGAYAHLLRLQEVAQEMGVNTPQAVKDQIAALQLSVQQGKLTQDQMDAIARSIDGIPKDPSIHVSADTSQAQEQIDGLLKNYQHVQYTGSAIIVNGRVTGFAAGGPISGPGTGTSDSIPAMLSNGEHVWTAREVQSAGGHNAVAQMRKAVLSGMKAFAAGGPVSWNISERFPVQPSHDMLASAAALAASWAAASANIPGNRADVAAIVQSMAAQRGWGSGAEWAALSNVINRESGWNPNAANPTSSARGLFQMMTSIYGPLQPTVQGQTAWGLNYIGGRYGDPINAWRHEQQFGWYRDGTNWVPNDGPAYLHRGEAVVPAAANQGAPYRGGRTAPLMHVENMHVNDQADIELALQQAQFRERSGAFS